MNNEKLGMMAQQEMVRGNYHRNGRYIGRCRTTLADNV